MAAQRLTEVTYNGGSFKSSYAIGLGYDNEFFDIWGMEGPYKLDIQTRQTGEESEAITLVFSGANGETREVALPKKDWLPQIVDRVLMTEEYNHHLLASNDEDRIRVDKLKAAHHDRNADTLEDALLECGIQASGDVKLAENGTPTTTLNATRDLFGSITDALTPLISKMGDAGYSARPKGRDDL